jgi:hypothetical protein
MTLRVALVVLLAMCPEAALAQDEDAHGDGQGGPVRSWVWSAEGSAFLGYNYQYRKFTDFDAVESQNWISAWAERPVRRARLRLMAMSSIEAATVADLGSPQVFQTGETYKNAPIIDYQHPHDLWMNLGAQMTMPAGGANFLAGAFVVGNIPLGPPPFMHRPSAVENPQAPLSHHYLDATHITHGVVSGGVDRAGWRVEGAWFRGREPDENRIDLDLGALDSAAIRLSWTRGAWSAQVSNAWLTWPERLSPTDATRRTASVSYFRGTDDRSLSWMAAFGQNREVFGHFDAWLLEATWRLSRRHAFYGRGETIAKDILDAGYHPIGIPHTHRPSQVNAVTVGYVNDPWTGRFGRLGIGGDITAYGVPDNLVESYGSPLSFHVFLRFRGRAGQPGSHVH